MLLLSYHKRLRMISEALELYVEGGRVSNSWCMCVVMVMVGWVGSWMEVVDGPHAGQSRGWSHDGRCRSICRVRGDTLTTPDSNAIQVRISGYGRT